MSVLDIIFMLTCPLCLVPFSHNYESPRTFVWLTSIVIVVKQQQEFVIRLNFLATTIKLVSLRLLLFLLSGPPREGGSSGQLSRSPVIFKGLDQCFK